MHAAELAYLIFITFTYPNPTNMKKIVLLIQFVALVFIAAAQQVKTSPVMKFPLKAVFNMNPENDTWAPRLKVQKLPKPHTGADEATIKATKQALDNSYRSRRDQSAQNNKSSSAAAPFMLKNFPGNAFNFYLPNDNDLAVSDSGFVASVNNTMIYGKNTATNQVFGSVTLHSLVATLGLTMEEFDPKVIYDPSADRFVLVFLNGFSDSTSNIIVGFSQGNTTVGLWNFYTLPGDALGNGLWTDFPMMTVSNNELFISVNLLYNDSSWITGFDQTIIWQINKNNGYSGQSLTTLLHSNVQYNGSKIRNMCPVKGDLAPYGPGAYFVSNRNFSAGNDTIFLLHITDTIGSPNLQVNISALQSPLQYRMPVDADQLGSPDKLIVNDARIMGAFLHGDKIHFVSTTLDTLSGYDGIYYGWLDQVTTAPVLTATIYTVANMDVAYPNIAYAGTSPGDERTVFGFLFSSATGYPGCAAASWDGTSFSPRTVIRNGSAACNMLQGDERWGDYTGCQTRYNQPGFVWVNGSHTLINNFTYTYIAELTVTTAAGISEKDVTSESLVYPNPSYATAAIRFINPSPGKISISLYDNQGKLLSQLFNGSLVAGENEIQFKTESLSAGLYTVVIRDSNNKDIVIEKLVKNK